MTLKEIKKFYKIVKIRKNVYQLYSKDVDTSSRFVYRYFCELNKINSYSFYLNDRSDIIIRKVSDLVKNVDDYLSNLPFNSDYYNKQIIHGAAQDYLLHDLLKDNGFVNNYLDGNIYRLDRKSIYGYNTTDIKISYDIDKVKKTVSINLYTGEWSWVSVTSSFDFKDIKDSFYSLIKPLLITESASNITSAEDMIFEGSDITKNEINMLTLKKTKMELKQALIDMANKL